MESSGDGKPVLLSKLELQKLWDVWVGERAYLRNVYIKALDQEPPGDPLARANRAAVKTFEVAEEVANSPLVQAVLDVFGGRIEGVDE